MGGMGFSHLSNVGVGTVIRKVICIGVGKKLVGLGVCGNKDVEHDKGYGRAMRDFYSSIN